LNRPGRNKTMRPADALYNLYWRYNVGEGLRVIIIVWFAVSSTVSNKDWSVTISTNYPSPHNSTHCVLNREYKPDCLDDGTLCKHLPSPLMQVNCSGPMHDPFNISACNGSGCKLDFITIVGGLTSALAIALTLVFFYWKKHCLYPSFVANKH
jgi:hypothetical protein